MRRLSVQATARLRFFVPQREQEDCGRGLRGVMVWAAGRADAELQLSYSAGQRELWVGISAGQRVGISAGQREGKGEQRGLTNWVRVTSLCAMRLKFALSSSSGEVGGVGQS